MRYFLLLLVFGLSQLVWAADNPPQQQAEEEAASQDTEQVEEENDVEVSEEVSEEGEDLILAEVEDDPDQSSRRFIPTEEISQDLGVSFPVDI